MSFPVLEDFKGQFPAHAHQIATFHTLYTQKLWHELSQAILTFIYHDDVKGKLTLNFYNEFVKKFNRNIDQISHLKILKQSLVNVSSENAIAFLENFEEKDAITEENKTISAALRANYYVGENPQKCSELYHRIQKYLKQKKDSDSFVFSVFYRFAYNYFQSKNKKKAFYENALQYLAYTPGHEIEQNQKINLLSNMGIAILSSPEIYNFSELLEQPLLRSLQKSNQYRWVYELLVIFNQGNFQLYESVSELALSKNKVLFDSKDFLIQKIKLMAFLELAFNLPKNNRTVSFDQVSRHCSINLQDVQRVVMKAASLKLIKTQIDQINQQVTITWIAPKVLGNDRIEVMLKKFSEWETGVKEVQTLINHHWKIKA